MSMSRVSRTWQRSRVECPRYMRTATAATEATILVRTHPHHVSEALPTVPRLLHTLKSPGSASSLATLYTCLLGCCAMRNSRPPSAYHYQTRIIRVSLSMPSTSVPNASPARVAIGGLYCHATPRMIQPIVKTVCPAADRTAHVAHQRRRPALCVRKQPSQCARARVPHTVSTALETEMYDPNCTHLV